MSSNILFIFEGSKTENNFIKSLEKFVLPSNTIIKCSYCTDIYQLYREISLDNDIDTFNLIKEKNSKNAETLEPFKRDDFAEIYLFFDYDGHSCLASAHNTFGNEVTPGDEKINEMLLFFNNETEKGKLYLSYPMIEAIRHLPEDFESFKDIIIPCKGKNCLTTNCCINTEECIDKISNYKRFVNENSIKKLSSLNGYNLQIWKLIIKSHLYKLNYIVNDDFEMPIGIIGQDVIFQCQLNKYINTSCPKVSVLGSIPVFIYDYFGHSKTLNLIE